MKLNLLDTIDNSFSIYAAMTIQDRAIVDARDCLKPAQRQCMYAQIKEKIIHSKPFKKSHKSVAAAMDLVYIHGDSSCYALLARMAKPFAMRYPLEDFDGSYGTISGGNTEAASRYTEMRVGELGCLLFDNIQKDCIDNWFYNYDDTELIPTVTPSLGYYNICNGSMGIATGLSSSIPQFNISEVNEALVKLLWNPEIDFDEIYCAPDFCTGGMLLNANEVKESLRVGYGRSAILRSVVEYDDKENAIHIKETPYGVYTSTIIEQLKKAIENEEIVGIKKVDDLSGKTADIKITLEKGINVNKLTKLLYKLTSTQSSYTINMTMLDKGTTPRVFGWRDALQAHLDHEIHTRTLIHQYEISKILKRINIIDGLLIAIANIEEVVQIIKSANNKESAKEKLIKRFNFNDEQSDAILKMTLSRLINLEIESFKNEKDKLLLEQAEHQKALDDKNVLYKEIETDLRTVAKKFGDARRTQILNLDYKGEADDAEPIEKKELLIHYTNLGNLYTVESSTLIRARRGTNGTKIKLASNETIVQTLRDDNFSSLLAFTNKGQMYHINTDDLPINSKVNIAQLFGFAADEKPTALTTIQAHSNSKYFLFVTKGGMIKKSETSLYNCRRGKSVKAINLKEGDEVLKVLPINSENVSLLSAKGYCVRLDTTQITSIGRAAMGVIGIKLGDEDYVIDAEIVPSQAQYVITVTEKGIIKKASVEDFPITNRAIRGKTISAVQEDDRIISHLILSENCDIILIVNKKVIKINTSELRLLSRSALGVKGVTLKENEKVVDLLLEV